MSFWRILTTEIPLDEERDVMARIGLRFIWCTGPFFLLAILLSSFGYSRTLLSGSALFIVLIPIVGGAIDWNRLKGRREDVQDKYA
jgi:hypothetical protein